MTYEQFRSLIVVATYHATELEGKTHFRLGDIISKYSLSIKPTWRDNLLKDLTRDWRLDMDRHLGKFDNQRISVSGKGIDWVEEEVGSDNVAAYLEQHGALHVDDERDLRDHDAIDSRSWTGLPSSFELTESKRAKLVRDLDEALTELGSLNVSQEVQSQARAYILAIRALAESPEPQTDLIWEMINRANSLAGIASLFVSIIAIFT